ncbi:hypothetical protein AVEN_64677-1 [Araneus ventricosus]|uniref:RNA-directed DNA polymerase from mobile element jockey n=1 Tax=Araneus ventricosus TaxID=182803 RepID=A0A4Y2GMV3_ARAVE|nr:hypothetical protein AVEN_64677-1 [Araneus ventricosus]
MLLYKSLLRPLISYACPVWMAAANHHIKGLERVQNVTIRRITRMPWFIRNEDIRKDLDLPTLKEFYKKIAEKFYRKIDSSTNTAIINIPSYNPTSSRRQKTPVAYR